MSAYLAATTASGGADDVTGGAAISSGAVGIGPVENST
jgi:hypothetical protein